MEPARVVVEAAALSAPGRALDLACGRGRNAIYLAEKGWSVVAADITAQFTDPRIDLRLLDLEGEKPLPFDSNTFDMVCIIHFLWRPLFPEVRRLVRSGGVVVSAIHTVRSTMNPKYTVAMGELRSLFADWEILVDREDEIAEIVARRNG
ncbi:MAG TPA: methyltransferase domain-containing protein [Thermoanaerobaculia bacterium]|nr:methyltransferase domain-containing protein [Thermoanaerobaculia bacterium]